MTRSPLAERIFGKLAILVFATVFSTVPCHAAGPQDLEIMVNGPWSFVSYQNQLYIVAPADKTHIAYFWSSPDASMRTWMTTMANGYIPISSSSSGKNIYTLTFSNYMKSNQPPDEEPEAAYHPTTQVTSTTIQTVLTGSGLPRYAISVPMPDSVYTYSGDWGPGFAQAKISPTAAPTSATPAAVYSTWTILHYGLSSAIQTGDTISVALDGRAQPGIAIKPDFDRNNTIERYGISIALMEAPLCENSPLPPDDPTYYGTDCSVFPSDPVWADDENCDTLSGLSFALSTKLWGLSEEARFPAEQDDEGTQNLGTFYYACQVYSAANEPQIRGDQLIVAENNLKAAKDISQKISKLKSYLQSQSVKPADRLTKKADQSEIFEALLVGIADDTKLLFPHHVPQELGDALYCVCRSTQKGEKKSEDRSAEKSCRKLLPLRSLPNCVQGKTEKYLDFIEAQDKGSADCHSAQISINSVVQP